MDNNERELSGTEINIMIPPPTKTLAGRDFGALWDKGKGRYNGEIYLGKEKFFITVLPNTRKSQGNHPDFRIFWHVVRNDESREHLDPKNE